MQKSILRYFALLFTGFTVLGLCQGADTTYVKYNTILGPIDVQMLSDEAPLTVENFLAYVDAGSYTNSIFHRSEPGDFIQGGTFFVYPAKSGDQLDTIVTRDPIPNEFNVSNTRGTLALALVNGGLNTGTSGWFFNDIDTSATFDPQKYAVFGRVANAPSLAVMDALAALPTPPLFNPPLNQLPVINYTFGNSVTFNNLVYVYSIVRESTPVDATISLSGLAVTANGVAHQPIVTTNPSNLAAFITYNGFPTPPTAVGSYTVVANISSPGYDGSTTGTLVISARAAQPATATVKLTKVTATYDGNPHPVTATTTPAGLNVDILYNGSNVPPINAGTYAVTATIDDANYQGSAKTTVVIAKAQAGSFTVNNASVTYDDIPHRATANTTPTGLGVSFTYNKSATPPTTAGTYAVVAKINDPNYTSRSTATGTLTINPVMAATVTVPDESLPYNGKPQPATATTDPLGIALTYTYNGSATAPTAKGTYTVVATTKSPDVVNTASGMGTLTIAEGAATVTLGNLTAVVTGKPIAVTVTTVPAKLPVTVTYNGSNTPPSAVGTYTVVARVNDPNYAGSATGMLKITPVPPTAATAAASAIAPTTATLNGTSDPKGTDTTVTFQYGTTTSYGTTTTGQDIGAGDTSVPISAPIMGLTAATTYHYREVATSAGGVINGKDLTFTSMAVPTFPNAPSTPLLSASGAQVGLGVNPNGVATTVVIKYGTASNNLNLSTPEQSIGSGKSVVNVNAFLAELTPNTTYYYEVVATSAAGSYSSSIQSFTTLGFDTSIVAMKGDVANGTGGATYNMLGEPAINNSDEVAFAATVTTGAGNPVITSANDLGIWANQGGGALQLIAQTGGATAPGTLGTFSAFGDPVINNGGAVAFGGQLKLVSGQATSSTSLGVWSTINGSLQLVARQGDPAPGGSTFSNFIALAQSDANVIVFATMALADGVTAGNNFGIWEENQGQSLALVLQTGDTPGNLGKAIAGLTLASSESLVQGQTRSFAPSNGNLAALANFTDKSTGIVTVIDGVQALPYKVGDPAPPTNVATYSKFSDPIINDNNHIAFLAALNVAGSVTAANDEGIWAQKGNTLQQVVRTGDPVLGSANVFVSLSDPVYNANDVVAFAGVYKVGRTSVTGIYTNDLGSLALVTQTGSPAPGCPSGVNFSAFTGLALPDTGGVNNDGGVILQGTLTGTGVTAANNTGIWIVDTAGHLQLVVRTGDTLLPGKTVTGLTFLPYSSVLDGETRSFSTHGDLAFVATFSDKSTALFNIQFP